MNRRKALRLIAGIALFPCCFTSCFRPRYRRPYGELDIGTVRSLLYSAVHVRSKAVLVFRDKAGWSALSARCTFNGCDLSLHEKELLCPCCDSRFDLSGRVLKGPASAPLPWMKIRYKDGHLYTNPGETVNADYRFTTPEIEAAIAELGAEIREERISDGAQITEALLGSGDGEKGIMFLEDDPVLLEELDMIK